jgi:hypothetical protein
MHIFNISTTAVKGLKNVRIRMWEELMTQSRYTIIDAPHPPAFTILKAGCTFCNPAKNADLEKID